MRLVDIHEQATAELKIDQENLGHCAAIIPELHNRWYKVYLDEKMYLRNMEREYKKLYKERWEYYTGMAPDDVYKNNPFPHKILRQDIPIYLDSDDDLNNLKDKKILQEEKVTYLESLIKMIGSRSFQIRDAIEWVKFKNGSF